MTTPQNVHISPSLAAIEARVTLRAASSAVRAKMLLDQPYSRGLMPYAEAERYKAVRFPATDIPGTSNTMLQIIWIEQSKKPSDILRLYRSMKNETESSATMPTAWV